MSEGQRMKGNTATAWSPDAYKNGAYHSVEHDWIEDCDSGYNKCAAKVPAAPHGNLVDFEAMSRAAGEPYIIKARDFDPNKHEPPAPKGLDDGW